MSSNLYEFPYSDILSFVCLFDLGFGQLLGSEPLAKRSQAQLEELEEYTSSKRGTQ